VKFENSHFFNFKEKGVVVSKPSGVQDKYSNKGIKDIAPKF
jgi:hypothetical protein